MTAGYRLLDAAFDDIDGICTYLSQFSFDVADRLRDEIYEAIVGVVRFPYSGHTRSELTERPLRFTRARDYLIAYAPEETPLLVIAVLHGKRAPETLSKILSGRH